MKDLKIKKITDCDRFSNYIDKFSINTAYGIDILKEKYARIDLKITFDVKKKSLGDRYIYLYYGEDAYVGSDLHKSNLYSSSISCARSGKWYSREREISISCDQLKSKNFAIVWRASGTGKDVWYCDDIKVNITCVLK